MTTVASTVVASKLLGGDPRLATLLRSLVLYGGVNAAVALLLGWVSAPVAVNFI